MRGRAAGLALLAATVITAGKIVIGLITGSVGVLSEGLHSLLDVLSAGVNVYTIREAGKPADEEHPFGHGKFETLSSLFEATLLLAAALIMVRAGISRLQNPQPLEHSNLAWGVMLVSGIASAYMYRHNLRAARETDSVALEVNALHFLSDALTCVGVVAGLVLMQFTGWLWLDPVIAFSVAAYVLVSTSSQVRKAIGELADRGLPDEEIKRIQEVCNRFRARPGSFMINAHDIRTRKAGSTRHIDFHLVLCGKLTVNASHDLCDEIEKDIEREITGASVTIHVEPCESERPACRKHCLFGLESPV